MMDRPTRRRLLTKKVSFVQHLKVWPLIRWAYDPKVWTPNTYLRKKLKKSEGKGAWRLLFCCKRKFTPVVAARVGDVLRDVSVEWAPYLLEENFSAHDPLSDIHGNCIEDSDSERRANLPLRLYH
jgi:hypothetical protein